MSLFYVPNIKSTQVLPEEESLHAVKVLRLQEGDDIVIVDGEGGYYTAKITVAHHKRCGFEIVSSQSEYGKRNYKLHIAIAPTKNMDRLEWFIEKATEIGIGEITPVICRHSEPKAVKEERLEKIIVSASKQSIKAYFPRLNPALGRSSANLPPKSSQIRRQNSSSKNVSSKHPSNQLSSVGLKYAHADQYAARLPRAAPTRQGFYRICPALISDSSCWASVKALSGQKVPSH